MQKILLLCLFCTAIAFCGCKDDNPITENTPQLIFKFKFDPTQQRLNNFGQPATMPATNAGQSPTFHQIAAHYIELAPNAYTQLGSGTIIYDGPRTTQGGTTAIDFDQEIKVAENETFISKPLKDMQPGNYSWLRVSLAYQNYDIQFRAFNTSFTGRIASFVGFNTYITTHTVNNTAITLNQNKLQGYWAFEPPPPATVLQGSAPVTTVPNPISTTSPIPAGSCVVTGQFDEPLIITGNETQDVVVTISLSTNNSFEWQDLNNNNLFDPLEGETVVDMGLRGLKPLVEQ